ncbi:MAG: hypothetical protein GY929_04080 [Actinomycetia bacterium]|nr:hypothetical protein [Actinomycetes bacterium]
MTDSEPVEQALAWCEKAGFPGGAPRGGADGAVYLHEHTFPVTLTQTEDDLELNLRLPVPAEALRGSDALATDRLTHLVAHTAALRPGRLTGSLVDGPEGLMARFVRVLDIGVGRGGVLDALADLDRCRLDFHELVALDLAAASARRATDELARQLVSLGDEITRLNPARGS